MKSNRTLIITIIFSVLLHLCLLLFIKFVPEDDSAKKESKPVEVEIIPKERKPIVEYNEPVTDDEKTTLDHDKAGGEKKAEGKDTKSAADKTVSAKPSRTKNVNVPKTVPKIEEKSKVQEDKKEENKKINLFDNAEIINRIANIKEKQPKGEDTASYNEFEEKYASYFAKFRRRVYQLWDYPNESVNRGEQGIVQVSFSILKDGSIVNIRLINSSGHSRLDREVMRVLKNMGKIPLPESYELNQLNVDEAYFIYTIGGGLERFLR